MAMPRPSMRASTGDQRALQRLVDASPCPRRRGAASARCQSRNVDVGILGGIFGGAARSARGRSRCSLAACPRPRRTGSACGRDSAGDSSSMPWPGAAGVERRRTSAWCRRRARRGCRGRVSTMPVVLEVLADLEDAGVLEQRLQPRERLAHRDLARQRGRAAEEVAGAFVAVAEAARSRPGPARSPARSRRARPAWSRARSSRCRRRRRRPRAPRRSRPRAGRGRARSRSARGRTASRGLAAAFAAATGRHVLAAPAGPLRRASATAGPGPARPRRPCWPPACSRPAPAGARAGAASVGSASMAATSSP